MDPAQVYKIARYLISGGTGVLINLIVLYAGVHYLHVWYLFASAAAFIIAYAFSFVLQKYWTFKDSSKRVYTQALWYVLVAIVNVALNTIIVYVGVHGLHIYYLAAQIIGSALVAIESYFIYHAIFTSGNGGIPEVRIGETA